VNALFHISKFRDPDGVPTLGRVKAIVCHEYGPVEALKWEAVRTPLPGPGEVRIAVKAAGVNFADTLKVQGKHQVKVALPWTPGCELAGVVDRVGEGVDELRLHDGVVAVPDERAGGYAEYVVLRAERALPLPGHLGFTEAAAVPHAYGTALYALKDRARLAAGEWVLVLGAAGGVGLAALQVAAAMGARVIAAASTAAKRELASRHGAAHTVDYTKPDWRRDVLEITANAGVQVVFDPVGGDAFDEAVRTVAWEGRYLVIGFAAGRIPELKVNHPLVKGYEVVGVRYDIWRDRSWPAARANLARIVAWWSEGRLQPVVSRTEPMSNATGALLAIASRQVVGKLVLCV
jgi:NADPH:quinone reductase